MAGTLASNIVVPLSYCFWAYCCVRWRPLFNRLLGCYIVSNGILAASAATMIWAVEHHLCPNDSAVEIVAALFLFVTMAISGEGARCIFVRDYRMIPPPTTNRRKPQAYREMDEGLQAYTHNDSDLRKRIHHHSGSEEEEIV